MEYADFVSSGMADNVLSFTRTLAGTTIKVAINFNDAGVGAKGLEGEVLASYNGASQTALPALSAIVVKA